MLLNGEKMPDILDCIASLSNDEVFTPPIIAEDVVNMLPDHIWSDPNIRILDPCCKTGVFLKECATKLLIGLEPVIPDLNKRREHIYKNMLYGIALTKLTHDITKRTLYYTKDAANELSVVRFDNHDGNIYYRNLPHKRDVPGGNCIICGTPPRVEELKENREKHAYAFIHKNIKEIFDMDFDVIIGNPPYQMADGGEKGSARPLYHLFVEAAIKMDPQYLCMITPSRWFAGGKGLDEFREHMLSDKHIRNIVDYPDASECFPGVEIKGGVNYFLWDRNYNGPCEIKTMREGKITSTMERDLDSGDGIFIRSNQAISILQKVQEKNDKTLNSIISSLKPFGIRTFFRDFQSTKDSKSTLKVYYSEGRGQIGMWMEPKHIVKNVEAIKEWKVFTPRAYGAGENIPHQITGVPFVGEPGSCATETYLMCGPLNSEVEANNMVSYMKTRFLRFLVSLRKNTQDIKAERFSFVPYLDMNITWTDEMLYKRYSLTKEEIAYIESQVKEML